MSSAEALQNLEQVLEQSGIQAGITLLNARVAHRYTCVYQLKGNVLKSLYLCDKLGELTPESLQSVPLEDSFCQFMLRDGIFATFSSSHDERVDDVKAADAFEAYVGVPLLDRFGDLFGTLCHIDRKALDLSAEEFSILEKSARLISRHVERALIAAGAIEPTKVLPAAQV
ncbi:hypothetical protein [Diaphorobacter aerolatus]|uniref:GAF domain-containing protein n=1 Tax=Diaphorobacter aerolatus TaxID=1288495 RepID=A0A7H0GKI3_9BURK|nr:hypothetical protein [Diaphorobacter aerolatus]QNP48799.1 hypothetical protein H9K75_00745 [Diaphorobacter aerolatus]